MNEWIEAILRVVAWLSVVGLVALVSMGTASLLGWPDTTDWLDWFRGAAVGGLIMTLMRNRV